MKKTNFISAISLVLSLCFFAASYISSRLFDKIYFEMGFFSIFIVTTALIGMLLVFASANINPKIGALPLMLLLLTCTSLYSELHRGSLNDKGQVKTEFYRGFPFKIYESIETIDSGKHTNNQEHYVVKGMILNFLLSAGIVTLASIKKTKLMKTFKKVSG